MSNNPRNGFMTSIWGPMIWNSLHIITLNYPLQPTQEDKQNYYTYIKSLQKVLPCGKCRANMLENMKKIKFTKKHSLKSRQAFARWAYDFHNEVNRMLGQPLLPPFPQFVRTYEMFRAKCQPQKSEKSEKSEKGCVVPLNHVKTKCVIHIVPQDMKVPGSLIIDKRCHPRLKKKEP